jgi:glycerophosphoryl diester phosphodiesterase
VNAGSESPPVFPAHPAHPAHPVRSFLIVAVIVLLTAIVTASAIRGVLKPLMSTEGSAGTGGFLAPGLRTGPGPGSGADSRAGSGAASGAGHSGAAALVVIAHRGGSETYPHESLPALVAAAEDGADVLTDVHWTSDDVPVLIHEGTTLAPDRTSADTPMVCTGGPYVIARTTWKVLRGRCRSRPAAAKDGRQYPIAGFDEAMRALSQVPGTRVFPEVKDSNPTADQLSGLLATIERYGMVERTVVSSWFPQVLERIRSRAGANGVALRLMRFEQPGDPAGLLSARELSRAHLFAVAVHKDGVTRAYVAALRAADLFVTSWRTNTEAGWAAARAAGASAVITDRPAACLAWITATGGRSTTGW